MKNIPTQLLLNGILCLYTHYIYPRIPRSHRKSWILYWRWKEKNCDSLGCPSWKVIFNWRSSSLEGSDQLKVIFRLRLSSIKSGLALEVVFHQRSSSNGDSLHLKVVFHQRLSSIKVCLSSKVIFYQRSSSSRGYLDLALTLLASDQLLRLEIHLTLSFCGLVVDGGLKSLSCLVCWVELRLSSSLSWGFDNLWHLCKMCKYPRWVPAIKTLL